MSSEINGQIKVVSELQQTCRKRRFSTIADSKNDINENKNSCVPNKSNDDEDGTTMHDDDGANEAPATKYREVEATVTEFLLTQFSDEVLFEIFRNLDTWNLMSLMNTCQRFHTLVLDHRFWIDVDLNKEPLPLGIIEDVLERSNVNTECIKLRGPPPSQHVDSEILQFNRTLAFTFAMRCTRIRVLELQGVTIDFNIVSIKDYPKTLKRLIFNDCSARMPECTKSIFGGMESHLTDLEELGIEYSNWFDPYYICSFSKLPELRWLSLKGCQTLVEFVPYGSMSARLGFRRLEYLDMRFTPISDSDLQCFNAVKSLKEILLDCPDAANEQDGRSGEIDDDENLTLEADVPCTSASLFTVSRETNADSSTSSSSSSSSSSSPSSSSSSSTPPPNADRVAGSNSVAAPLISPGMAARLRNGPRQGPDQVIYLDLHNRHRPIVVNGPVRRVPQNADHLEQVLNHPLFWNMIDPLPRVANVFTIRPDDENAPGAEIAIERSGMIAGGPPSASHRRGSCLIYNRATRNRYPISDRGICCLARPQHPVDQGVIWIRIGNRPSGNRFERLTVRNYKMVTDISLQNLVQSSPNLLYLDLSGTSVTMAGVRHFRELKKNCIVIADHLTTDFGLDNVLEPIN